jgi:recombinational DNA repair protein (RecF pathway)
MLPEIKHCNGCKKDLPTESFSIRYGGKKLVSKCKKCRNEQNVLCRRLKRESEGNLFRATRRFKPERADSLDSFRERAKSGLPM